jgi:3-hydroxyacyl-CoA dehydrogenase/3-hydroxy-2-methylbutyryl-CoA dehydrogenase
MDISKTVAVVTGGASGLGEATVERLIAGGGKAAIFDRDEDKGQALAGRHPGKAIFCKVDVADEESSIAAVAATMEAFGAIHICVNCAGVGGAARTVGKNGPMPLKDFERIIRINLIGTFNISRLAGAEMLKNQPNDDGERGLIVNTSSLAGYEGQMGQVAYAASKAGVIGMTLPMVRDFSQFGVRVMTIAPGLFGTPLLLAAPQEMKDKLVSGLEFPKRMGLPAEFAALVAHMVENAYLNGEVIRLDAGTRAAPR